MTLAELEQNEKFSTLNFSEQTMLRDAWSQHHLVPQLQAHGASRQFIYDAMSQVLTRAPVLQTQDEKSMELMTLSQQIRDNPEFDRDGANKFVSQRMTEDFGLFSPIIRRILRSSGQELLGDAEEDNVRSDRAKAYEHFMATVRTDEELSGMAKATDILVPLVGAVGTALASKVFIAKGLGALGLHNAGLVLSGSSQFKNVIPTASRLIDFLASKVAPQVGSSMFDGAVQTMAIVKNEEYMAGLVDAEPEARGIRSLAGLYGREVALDFGMWSMVQVAFRGARTIRAVMPKTLGQAASSQTIVQRNLASVDIDAWTKKALTGDFSVEELAQFPVETRAHMKFLRNWHHIDGQLNVMTREGQAFGLAQAKGFQLTPTGTQIETSLDKFNRLAQELYESKKRGLDALEKITDISPAQKRIELDALLKEYNESVGSVAAQQTKAISGWELRDLRGEKITQVGKIYATTDDAIDAMLKHVDAGLEQAIKQTPQGALGLSSNVQEIMDSSGKKILQAQDVIRITPVLEGTAVATKKAQSTLNMFQETMSSGNLRRGTQNWLDPDQVLTMTRKVGESLGIPEDTLKGLKTKLVSRSSFEAADSIIRPDGTLLVPVRLGVQVGGMLDEQVFGSKLLKALKTVGGKNTNTEVLEQFQTVLKSVGDSGATPSWLKNQIDLMFPGAKVTLTPAGDVVLRTAEGAKSYASSTSLAQDIFQRQLKQASLVGDDYFSLIRKNALNEFSIEIERMVDADGLTRFVAKKAGAPGSSAIVDTTASIEELVNRNPWLMPKFPVELAPTNVVVSGQNVQIIGDRLVGDVQSVLEHMENFKNYGHMAKKTIVSRLKDMPISLDKTTQVFEVNVPGMNWTGRFNSKKELIRFLQDGFENTTSLTYLASSKGAQVVWTHDHWLVRTLDGKFQAARNLDELKDVVAKLPNNSQVGKELIDMGSELNEFVSKELSDIVSLQETSINAWAKSDVDDVINMMQAKARWGKDSPGWMGFSMNTRLRPEVIRDIAIKTGDVNISRSMVSYEKAIRATKSSVIRAESLLNQAWDSVPLKDRIQVLPLLEYAPEQWADKLKALQRGVRNPLELTDNLNKALLAHRDFTERVLRTEFGISGYKAQADYLPRMRQFLLENQDRLLKESVASKDPQQYLAKVLGQEFGEANTNWFAQNMRTEELGAFLGAVDPVDLTMSYIRSGYKNKFMAPEFNRMLDITRKSAAEADYKNFIYEFLHDSMGYSRDLVGDGFNRMLGGMDATLQVLKAKGGMTGDLAKISRVHRDFVSTIQKPIVAATMSFRPGLWLRNIHQVYTVGGLYQPYDSINEGFERLLPLLKDQEGFVKKFINTNVLKNNITPYMEMADHKTVLDKITQLGMRDYMNSDTINRATMYLATEASWDRALGKLKVLGPDDMNFKQFMSWTEADLMSVTDIDAMTNLWRTQGMDAARNFHASRVIDMTQFTYEQMFNPRMMNQSTLGRLFGMFGHYPVSYVETLRQVISQRSGEKLLRTLGRTAAASAGIVAAHHRFGLDPTSYTPWGQMSFTGGPVFNYSLTLMQSTNMRSFEGTQARARLSRDTVSLFVPGSALARSWSRAIDSANEGDSYGTFMRVLSLPYVGFD